MRTPLVAALLLLTGCSDKRAAVQRDQFVPAPHFSAVIDTSSWLHARVEGLAVLHPPNAVIVSDTDRFSGLVGSALEWRFDRTSYLRIAVARVSPHGTLPNYLDSVRTARNANYVDQPDMDWALIAPPRAIALGPYHGYQLGPTCGDCVAYETYVEIPDSWVAVSFSLEQGLPYTYEQQDSLYRRIQATLRAP